MTTTTVTTVIVRQTRSTLNRTLPLDSLRCDATGARAVDRALAQLVAPALLERHLLLERQLDLSHALSHPHLSHREAPPETFGHASKDLARASSTAPEPRRPAPSPALGRSSAAGSSGARRVVRRDRQRSGEAAPHQLGVDEQLPRPFRRRKREHVGEQPPVDVAPLGVEAQASRRARRRAARSPRRPGARRTAPAVSGLIGLGRVDADVADRARSSRRRAARRSCRRRSPRALARGETRPPPLCRPASSRSGRRAASSGPSRRRRGRPPPTAAGPSTSLALRSLVQATTSTLRRPGRVLCARDPSYGMRRTWRAGSP